MKYIYHAVIIGLAFPVNSLKAESLDKKMKSWIQSQADNYQVSEGTKGQSGGYFSGPSIKARFPSQTIGPFVNFTAPHLSAGCGGIDFSAGAVGGLDTKGMLSAIDAVSTAIPGVAISVAMQVLTPQLTATLQEWQKKAEELTKMSLDSCNVAKSLVKGSMAQMGLKEEKCISDRMDSGEPYNKARENCVELGPDEQLARRSNEKKEQDLDFTQGNLTWYLMYKSGKFTEGDIPTIKVVMNLAGTVVVKASPKNGPAPYPSNPEDIISPANPDTNSALFDKIEEAYIKGADAPIDVSIRGCKTEAWAPFSCDEIEPNQIVTLQGTDTERVLIGRMQRILEHIYSDDAYETWDKSLQQLVNATDTPLYKFLIALAAYMPGSISSSDMLLTQYANLYARNVFLGNFLSVLSELDNTQKAIKLTGETIDKYSENLRLSMRAITRRIDKNHDRLNTYTQMIERTTAYEKIMADRLGTSFTDTALWSN